MHELFITATIPADGRIVRESLAVIQGYTNMCPVQMIKRKVNFKGPRGPQDGGEPLPGFAKEALRPKSNSSDADTKKLEALVQLNQRIIKNSYYIPILWREDLESESDATSKPGTLRFAARPDVFPSPIVSRAFIEITDDHLPRLLESAGYTKVAENFAELYHAFHENMTFELKRILADDAGEPLTGSLGQRYREDYEAYGNAWLFNVKVEVTDMTKPVLVDHATKLLQKVCADLQGYFVFDQLDPAALDPKARWFE